MEATTKKIEQKKSTQPARSIHLYFDGCDMVDVNIPCPFGVENLSIKMQMENVAQMYNVTSVAFFQKVLKDLYKELRATEKASGHPQSLEA